MMMPPKTKRGGNSFTIKLIVLFLAGCISMCGVLGITTFFSDSNAQQAFSTHIPVEILLISMLIGLILLGLYVFKFMAEMIIKEKDANFETGLKGWGKTRK